MLEDKEYKAQGYLRYLSIASLFAVFAFLFLFAMRNICSYDYWWHVASGRWILQNGIMRSDPFSFTAKGAPLIDPYWLGQILLYLTGSFAVPFKVVVIAAAFTFSLFAAPKSLRVSAPASVLVLLGILVAHERFLCRPEIFTLLFCAVTVWLLFQPAERKKRLILFVPLLTVLWVNLHPGWVLAPAMLVAFGAGRLIGRLFGFSTDEKITGNVLMTAAGLLCFIAALINPYFIEGMTYPFRLTAGSHEIGAFVEWVSPLPRLSEHFFSFDLIHFKLLALALAGSFILNYKEFDFGKAAVSLLVLVLALSSLRHFGVFALVSIPVILHNIEPFRLKLRVPEFARAAASVIIILTALYYCEEAATNRYYAKRELYNLSFGFGVSDTTFPRVPRAHDVYPDQKGRRVFHNYELGGYRLYGGGRVFIDGRLVHYPKEVYEDYVRIQSQPDYWDSFCEKYNIESVYLIHNLPRMQKLIVHIYNNPRWNLLDVNPVTCRFIKHHRTYISELSLSKQYPEFSVASLARFYLNIGKPGAAVGIIERYRYEQSRNGKLQLYYGRALAESGQLTKAVETLERAVELLPGSVETHLNLGVVYSKLGRHDEARREWKRIIELDPRNEEALRYLSALDRK